MQARAPDEGPSHTEIPASEIGGRPVIEDSNAEGCRDPRLLRAVVAKYNIDSTASLVATYNNTNDKGERAVLLGWLRKYGSRSEECLTPDSVLEYSELANIAHRSQHDKGILKSVVDTLSSCLCQREFLKPNVAAALHRTLVLVDCSAHDSVADLVELATKLLDSLSPRPKLERGNFSRHEATFLALHQTFFLLNKINRKNLYEREKQELRRSIAEKEKELELSCKYYPVNFHFGALRQAVERFEVKDPSSHVSQAMWCGLCGLLHVLHCLRNLTNCDIDPAAIADAFRGLRQETVAFGVPKRPWFDVFQTVMATRLEASKDEVKLAAFGSECDTAMESQKRITGDALKALRFGIVQEIRQLASQTFSEAVRKEAATKLLTLTTSRATFEEWFDDADIFTAFLDALHEVHTTSGDNQETAEAFRQMQRSCEGRARSALEAWLGGDAMENKLEMRHQRQASAERNKLFVGIGRDFGYVPLDTIRSNIKDLKEKYKHDNFAKVPSLFGTELGYHVKEMEHHVVVYEEVVERTTANRREGRAEEGGAEGPSTRGRDHPREHYEQKRKVTKPVSLEELFRPRSLKAGDPESEIRSVLLYGNPGSGKTCISKVIAHKWALGEIMQEFEAMYVVPVRRVNVAKSKGPQGPTVKDVVAQTCFRERSGVEYEDLLTQVEGDLDLPTTLLVFDGLDEATEDARELVHAAEKRLCKLLILTRPYNLQQTRARVDCQFECLGFNDRQLRNYINRELGLDQASRLILSLQRDRGMWETAHTPVTAHILCSLSKQHGTSIENRGKRASMFQIYGDMTNYVWERFKKRPEARMVDKDVVFGDLEKIAFEALRSGQILIEERIVKSHATSTNTTDLFKESGFLLFLMEGQEYQFPHLTFQEYFAGRFIARSLKNKGSNEEKRVLKFIQDGKYNRKNDVTMHFAMHAFARGRGLDALQTMLSTFGDQPVEVLGAQHFFLKTRILEATLEEADEDELEDLLEDEQAIELAEGARHLLERTIDDVLIREIVIEEFRKLTFVLEGFPQVLDAVIDRVKRILRRSDRWTWKTMTKIEDILKLARNSSKQSNIIIQFVLRLVEEPDGWCTPIERIKRLTSIAEQMRQHAGAVLPTLANRCVDENSYVRRYAMEAIGRVVSAAPQHAGEVLPTLKKGCVDEDSYMRRHAKEAIGRVVSAAPQHAGEFLPTLAKGCGDEDSGVRRNSMEAIGRVVSAAPQHAGEVLPTLAKGCVDKNFGVRRGAMEAIGRVVSAAPQHAGEVLPTLAKGCVDEESYVRIAARTALDGIKPEKVVISAMSILPAYKDILFFFVLHSFAFDPSKSRKTVPFVLHTTSSVEIGKWSKDDIALLVGFLRREFDEKFPGLLGYLETKE